MAEEIRPRASWDEYFMSIAQVVATRSTCPRKYVGAVIVRNRTILSTGYNGSIRGMPHCSDVGHMMEDGHCVATIHAEANAIIQAARNGVNIDGAHELRDREPVLELLQAARERRRSCGSATASSTATIASSRSRRRSASSSSTCRCRESVCPRSPP